MPGCGPEEEAAVGVSEEVVVDSSRFFLEEDDGLDETAVGAETEHGLGPDDIDEDGEVHVALQHHQHHYHHLDGSDGQQQSHLTPGGRHRRSHHGSRHSLQGRVYQDVEDEEVR